MTYLDAMMLYIGPETVMPLASILAAVTGALLLVWRRTVALVRAVVRRMTSSLARR